MLTVQNITTQLGKRFKLDGITFSVAPGEVLAILGPNGSGKSTLLRLILGLDAARSGVIAWSDVVLSENRKVCLPPEDRGMSVLFQDGVLFPHLTVRENVSLGLAPRMPAEQGEGLVSEALQCMRIPHLGDQSIAYLSGGEQQRIALARALVRRPRVLLLDEPFHSLDAPAKRTIIAELRAIVKGKGIATVFVTHDMQEAWAFSDRSVLLRDGAKVQEGSMEHLYREPADPWTASFLGEVESMDAQEARGLGVELPAGFRGARVFFRPEDLVLMIQEDSGSGLVVAGIRPLGALFEVSLNVPNGSDLRSHVPARNSPRVGERVSARVARSLFALPPEGVS